MQAISNSTISFNWIDQLKRIKQWLKRIFAKA
jgi:hypothetical protein